MKLGWKLLLYDSSTVTAANVETSWSQMALNDRISKQGRLLQLHG